MGALRFTILGCGSSGGVPRLGGHWGDCDPTNPRNVRRRCSLLVERDGPEGTTTVLIDTTPDMRSQLLDTGTGRLDGVVYTHSHADHVHGIDDLRMIVFNMRERVPVYADGDTQNALLSRFGYAFIQPEGSPYPPILDLRQIDGPLTISGPGGDITLRPFEVNHGSIEALGFRIGDLAYLPDVAKIPDSALDELRDLDCWIIDALRRKPHPTHLCLDEALEWIERMAPKRAVLTNMHIDLDYAQVAAETPDHVDPAYDGMVIEYPI
ncbi:MBL fold metallo-hydrolase [Phaeobacter italicus]|jgi:phosphoribosyl 1,2-cyclic phosphate phosphodiesterase|uniref:MBL fold metallo-hydrolase n=1 Tax=Phaeobacter italicus TaxID=481446 RepID=UPI001ADC54F1|nr:MBL fold metallo-hydrolase [Phaeobacter italicus]MBO9441798.1 MBL fold metallo-hydrolase [Phaeobacter italicus]MBY5976478.1 MBL fold metallo-hydrolase [Phaeobacter italicus]MBY6043297.1 MBL fold metallo-hydrolase [Phaeobacter italicus]MCA0856952.1 MBL fold metallo-hydrolase [Phaeobacter italicus]